MLVLREWIVLGPEKGRFYFRGRALSLSLFLGAQAWPHVHGAIGLRLSSTTPCGRRWYSSLAELTRAVQCPPVCCDLNSSSSSLETKATRARNRHIVRFWKTALCQAMCSPLVYEVQDSAPRARPIASLGKRGPRRRAACASIVRREYSWLAPFYW